MQYNIKNIDVSPLEFMTRARAEANRIKSNPKDEHRRMYGDIMSKVVLGHWAEWISMVEMGHTDNPAEYRDTFDHEGVDCDHKVSYSRESLRRNISTYMARIILQECTGWPKGPTLAHRVYGWTGSMKTGLFTFDGVYNYNKSTRQMDFCPAEK